MARTLLDLFRGSPHDLAIKSETETFLEQETSGLRVKSAVELNNPLIYGSDVGRIMLRSTPSVELMKDARTPDGGTSGLIDKGISKLGIKFKDGKTLNSLSGARNRINDFLGIPQPLLPTHIWNKIDDNPKLTVQQILDEKNGTEFGKFLKQTGGGSPKTIANQAIGNAITLGKDKLRDTLFGKPPTIEEISGEKFSHENDIRIYGYSKHNNYTKVQSKLEYTKSKTKDDILLENWDTKHINLATVSPIYGVDRKSGLYNSKLGQRIVSRNDKSTNNWGLSAYSSDNRYVNYDDKTKDKSPISKNSLETKYGLSNISDDLNMAGGDNEKRTTEDLEALDLIPFWIGKVGTPKKTHFRTILTGITETVSPSWNTNNFFGNPFAFHTYSSIERNVSFSLQIYCSNITELLRNWERVSILTSYTYPTIKPIDGGRYAEPPIIDFRIGDIYNRKVGFIESLSYTYPDNGGWETDPEIGLLPKFIEVSITIKFIEDHSIDAYYNYEISDEASAIRNDKNGSSNFSTDPAISSNGKRKVLGVEKLDTKGVTPFTTNPPKSMLSINGNKSETPYESQNKTNSTNSSEPRMPNASPNKSSEELINESQSTLQLTKEQSQLWIGYLQPQGYKQEKNTTGINTIAGEVVYSHPDKRGVVIVNAGGDARADALIERRLNKDPFNGTNKTYLV